MQHQTSLKKGEKAPDFCGNDQNGKTICLKDYSGKKLVLYFYPKDDTPGCTATSCNLRDEYDYLKDRNYEVLGVSADTDESHRKFIEKYALPFPLIADTELQLIRTYDVWGPKMIAGRVFDGIIRTTFVIGENGLLEDVIVDVNKEDHARQISGEMDRK